MTLLTINLAAFTMLLMAILLTYILCWANKAFYVEVDPRIESITGILPGANCGGCGFVGCGDYAEAIVTQGAPVNKCPVGGSDCAAQIAGIMGTEVGEAVKMRPVIKCAATDDDKLQKNEYRGEKTCLAANFISGIIGCTYGCLGLGDCLRACLYDAIKVENGLANIDYSKCIGCGACATACPRNIIEMTPFNHPYIPVIACSNKDGGKEVMNVCKIGCIACKSCSKVTPLFTLDNAAFPSVDYENFTPEKMDEIKAAIEKCPRGGIKIIENK